MNRKERRNYLKVVNKKRTEVNNGAFGYSKSPRMSFSEIPRMTKEQSDKYTKMIPMADSVDLRVKLSEHNILTKIYNIITMKKAIKLVELAVIKENKEKETKTEKLSEVSV